MAISMYTASVPVFVRTLTNLGAFLDKAEAFCTARKIDPSVLINYRLAPDMLPFSKQIQIACDAAKLAMSRISGMEAPKFEDTETNFAELKERIANTIAFIKTVPAGKLDGTEDKDVTITLRGNPVSFKAETYLKHYAMANMWFHTSMAYAVLRHNGVELGKMDFIGNITQPL